MKKVFTSMIAVLLVGSMLLSLSGCGANGDIRKVIGRFEEACNSLDFNEVLECIDPRVSDVIKMAVGFAGMFSDTDTSEMFDNLSEYIAKGTAVGSEFFESIDIEIEEIEVEDESATVSALVTYEVNGSKEVRKATFACVYYIDEWYVSFFTIN